VNEEEANTALLRAFGWKGQGFWRQVRKPIVNSNVRGSESSAVAAFATSARLSELTWRILWPLSPV
jgi:hypothetical protein